ncbi:hypothetical protein LL912_25860 [Niabella sp. CC-SYL272]|uniref:M56 family metallopeptidase n=1 Tax=Niabella agricola TaxID=2891571 RepID=UPI001F3381E5|nr:M56 family metallopeptidase [Niabella agricola]MCF3112240.1 hypothetical protein [Niabella agricola]
MLYLLKVIACSGLLYVFYYCFLQKEKMLVFNRFYLLGSLLLSFLIPLSIIQVRLKPAVLPSDTGAVVAVTAAPAGATFAELMAPFVYWVIGIISSVLLLRFTIHLIQIRQKINANEQRAFEGARLVLLQEAVTPHSFFKYIFLNKADFERNRIDTAILVHELTHARQKHTWDIVLAEFTGALIWFNPFMVLYRRAIRLNHEFLADQSAGGKPEQRAAYQQLLLKSIYVNQSIPLASSFYFLTTKKRLLMLQQEPRLFRTGIKAALILPMLALLVFIFAERVYTQEPPPPPPKAEVQKIPDEIEKISVLTPNGKPVAVLTYKNGKKVRADISSAEKQAAFEKKYGVEIPPPPPAPPAPEKQPAGEKGMSTGEIDTYRILYKATLKPSGNAKPGSPNDGDKLQRMATLYFKMSESQKASVPPPPVMAPAQEAPAASAHSAIFAAAGREISARDPEPPRAFAGEPLSAPVEERVAPIKRVQTLEPLAPVRAENIRIIEVQRAGNARAPVQAKIPPVAMVEGATVN